MLGERGGIVKKSYEAISALAGSGKTYALTSRFIGLLARGAKPEEILAITFTRKAAGEIFDRIVQRLAEAALGEQARKDLGDALGEKIKPADPGLWLQTVLEGMPRLQIGTIDSLFVSIVKAFALDLGLPAQQEILDETGGKMAREEALRIAMETARNERDTRQAFMDAYKLMTFEKSKAVRDAVLETADSAHRLFLYHPDEAAWGCPSRVWETAPWWATAGNISPGDLAAVIGAFRASHLKSITDTRCIKAWDSLFKLMMCEEWTAAGKHTLLQKLAGQIHALQKGGAIYDYYKKQYSLQGSDASEALSFVAYVISQYVRDNMLKTAGCGRLMRAYEEAYRDNIRSRGRLSFEDVQTVLFEAGQRGLRMDIDYRLDGQFRHWMIDEFQDTSARQWAVLSSLADEALQGEEGSRTFFYVGDAKQAIYGWRGGDARLFDAVHGYYRTRFGEKRILDVSWRSSPVVLDAVNKAFGGNLDGALDELPAVLSRWRSTWQIHKVADRNRHQPGRVELLEAGGNDENVIQMACGKVEALRHRPGLSTAVLVRDNKFGDKVASALRARGVEVRREVNPRLCDNGVVSGLLSLLDWADHPGDKFARWHVESCGLPDVLRRQWGAGTDIPSRARGEASCTGIAGLLCSVIGACRESGHLGDAFIEMRLRQLLALAREYDLKAKGGLADFAARARRSEVKDPVVSGAVIVMTVHKAKGLEFDAVVLPDLNGLMADYKAGKLEAFSLYAEGVINPAEMVSGAGWVFPLPPKDMALPDAELKKFRDTVIDRMTYDELCLLYVAMTRARQGLYMITKTPPADSKSLRTDAVLRQVLAGDAKPGSDGLLYGAGDPLWHEKGAEKDGMDQESVEPEPFIPEVTGTAATMQRLMVMEPSREEMRVGLKASALFDRGGWDAASRGTLLHDLFQRVEWHAPDAAERILDSCETELQAIPAGMREGIKKEFICAMKAPEIIAALSRPSGHAELWREQGFELADEGRWITGRIDRVVVLRDGQGIPSGATVMDFKSDFVSTDRELAERVEKYGPQMHWYVTAVSRLLGLPRDIIRAQFIFTHSCKIYEMEQT